MKYFQKVGTDWQISAEIRHMVELP